MFERSLSNTRLLSNFCTSRANILANNQLTMPFKKLKEPKELTAPPKRQETTEVQHAQVITLCGEGFNYTKIAEKTGIKKMTYFDIVKHDEVYREPDTKTPYTASAPRSGCPPKMTRRQLCYLIHLAKCSHRAALGILCRSITIRVSMKTARGVLKEAGLQRRRAKQNPYLSKLQKLKWLLWCKEQRNWTLED